MNKLDRARKIFATSSRAGLKVIPLALLASSAFAITIAGSNFTLNSQSVTSKAVDGSHAGFGVSFGSDNSGFFVGGGNPFGGVNGLALSGDLVFTCLGEGRTTCDGSSVTVDFSGGIKGTPIPSGAGVSIYALSLDNAFDWDLLGSSGTASFNDSVATLNQQNLGLPIGADGSWSFALTITPQGEYEGGSTFELRVPGAGTIDVFATQIPDTSGTPEPSSILLGLGGGAFLMLRRLRRA